MFGKETKTETEELTKISVYDISHRGWLDLERSGVLHWRNDFSKTEWAVHVRGFYKWPELFCELRYTLTDAISGNKEYISTIQVETTPCKPSGFKRWFLCPMKKDGVKCGKRVIFLYLHNTVFACRDCHDLTYASQNKNHRRPENPIQQDMKDLITLDKLSKKIKRHKYKGKPTKKCQEYKDLWQRYLARMRFTTKE